MPKPTFFNLPPAKRRIIEQAALDEFVAYGFDKSNMNRIVAASGIAKGSFYQYFEDKKDLYFHLIDSLVTCKMEALAPALNAIPQHSFARNFEELFRLGLAFADSDPKYYLLGEDFVRKQPPFINEFLVKYQPLALDVYGKLLEQAKAAGELREDLSIPLASSFISALTNGVSQGLIAKNATKEQRNAIIDELLRFIEHAVLK